MLVVFSVYLATQAYELQTICCKYRDTCIRTDLFSDNVRVLLVISQTVPVATASRLSVLTVTYSPTVKPDLQRSEN